MKRAISPLAQVREIDCILGVMMSDLQNIRLMLNNCELEMLFCVLYLMSGSLRDTSSMRWELRRTIGIGNVTRRSHL